MRQVRLAPDPKVWTAKLRAIADAIDSKKAWLRFASYSKREDANEFPVEKIDIEIALQPEMEETSA